MEEYYNNCKYVCFSYASGFGSKKPVPTCRRFHYYTDDNALRGTFERCCDVAITGRCLIKGAEEFEKEEIKLTHLEYQKEIEKRKRLRKEGYDTRYI